MGISNLGQDQVSGEVSDLRWLAAPVTKCSMANFLEFGNKVKVSNKKKLNTNIYFAKCKKKIRRYLLNEYKKYYYIYDKNACEYAYGHSTQDVSKS